MKSEVLLTPWRLLVARAWGQRLLTQPVHLRPFKGKPFEALGHWVHPYALSGEQVYALLETFVVDEVPIPGEARELLNNHATGFRTPFWTIALLTTHQADIIGLIPGYTNVSLELMPSFSVAMVVSYWPEADGSLALEELLP